VSGRIVLFGATGYTGQLTARALVARGAAPVLAARSRARVEALAAELGGLPFAMADVQQPATVRALVEPGDVLISTVGPFLRWGEPALEAAIDAGAHYLDSSGEPPFIRAVFERYGPRAEAAGVGLLSAFGYDYVPGNLAGALALREAGERAVSVDVGYFVGGAAQPSGGTRASAVGLLAEPAYVFAGGRVVTQRTARSVRSFDGRAAVSVGATEQFALPRVHPGLRDARVWMGWFGQAARPLQAISAATALATRLPGVRDAIGAAAERFVKGSTGGPDAARREGALADRRRRLRRRRRPARDRAPGGRQPLRLHRRDAGLGRDHRGRRGTARTRRARPGGRIRARRAAGRRRRCRDRPAPVAVALDT
jgi:short subunit dehydrogenase-like uncharacterized protein